MTDTSLCDMNRHLQGVSVLLPNVLLQRFISKVFIFFFNFWTNKTYRILKTLA